MYIIIEIQQKINKRITFEHPEYAEVITCHLWLYDVYSNVALVLVFTTRFFYILVYTLFNAQFYIVLHCIFVQCRTSQSSITVNFMCISFYLGGVAMFYVHPYLYRVHACVISLRYSNHHVFVCIFFKLNLWWLMLVFLWSS